MKTALILFLTMMFGSLLFGKHSDHFASKPLSFSKRISHTRLYTIRMPEELSAAPEITDSDVRHRALLQYFQECRCPAAQWAGTFIREADRYGLDWRLVASISMIESTGGKRYKNHNILGWQSAAARFRSEREGIAYVSWRFGKSRLYAGKSVLQILRTYNSARRNYAAMVTNVMKKLGTIEDRLKMQQQAQLAYNPALSFAPQLKPVLLY